MRKNLSNHVCQLCILQMFHLRISFTLQLYQLERFIKEVINILILYSPLELCTLQAELLLPRYVVLPLEGVMTTASPREASHQCMQVWEYKDQYANTIITVLLIATMHN